MRHTKLLGTPRWKWLVFQVITIFDALFSLATLGYWDCEWRSALVFSDWMGNE